MARRSSRGSVYNKRSNERVQAARTSSGGGGGIIPQAYAQSSNPTQNQSPQARTQSTQFDPWARATQFVHNVGRGGYDVGRSYTTDIADTAHSIATGREQEQRSYRDETLATVFGRGLFEGNLEGSFAEASRRVQEQPGRVVGEVAAETAIMLGTMGFGAVAKGAKVGMTGVKSVRGATKAQGSTGWTRKTGLIRKGQEQKFVGDKTTTIIKTNRKGKVTTKTKKTNILDRMERFGAKGGEKFNKKIGRPTTLGSPMIIGASGKGIDAASGMPGNLGLGNDFNIFSKARGTKLGTKDIPTESITDNIATKSSGLSDENIGYMKQYEQFQSGATSVGDEVDPTFMGSMDNTIVPFVNETVEETTEEFFKRRARQVKGEKDNIQPLGQSTDRKMLDGSDSTQQEWIDFYQGKIESNSGIKRSKGITKTANEKGVGSKDSRVYSTDEFDQATKIKEKPRTHSASIPIDVAAAQVQAESIITSGFGKRQSAKDLKAQLDNLISGYASEDATIVKTNIQKNPKGGPIPENIGLGTDVEQFGLDKNNQVAGAIPTRIGEIFEEIAPKSFKGYGYRKGKEPKTQKGLIAVGKQMSSGGRRSKTGRERVWEIEGERGGSTELDYNQLSGDDIQIPGVSNMPIDEQDFLVATQIDPVKMVGGKLVGNPQLGLSDQANAKAAEKALNAILGPVGGSDAGYWAGKRIPHFGYDGFRVKYNLGQLPAQKGVKPTKQLPPKLSTFLQQRNLTYKDYYDLNFQTISRGKDKSLLKRFVDGDVVKEEYTGDVYEDSIWTKENFMAAGSGTRKGDLLPQQNLVEEIKIVNRNRVSPVRKPVVERSSTPWTPKSIIEKDDSLVGFNIKNIRELVKQQGTTAVRRRVSNPSKKVIRNKTKPKKKVNSFADMPSLFDNNLGLNPDTGDVDPTLIRMDYNPPSWFMGGGDTTILGGSIRPKPKQARLKNIKRKPKFNTFISSVLYREDQMDDFAGDRLAEARFRQRNPDWWMP